MAFGGIEKTRFGVSTFPTDYGMQPVELAKAAEERGFDSLFFPEHTHIPVSRATPFPGGGELPKQYWRAHDPFVALAACAAVTERIRLGTGICLIIERDPITTAKAIASLDMISDGRAIIGVGAGWNREEMENHGASYRHRWAITREKVLAMRAIWNNEEAEFHGEHCGFRSALEPPQASAGEWPADLDRRQLEVGIRADCGLCGRLDAHRGLGFRQHGALARSDGRQGPQGGGFGLGVVRRPAGRRPGGGTHQPRLRPRDFRSAAGAGGDGAAAARPLPSVGCASAGQGLAPKMVISAILRYVSHQVRRTGAAAQAVNAGALVGVCR